MDVDVNQVVFKYKSKGHSYVLYNAVIQQFRYSTNGFVWKPGL